MGRFGLDNRFRLGDLDLALNLYRSSRLAAGDTLTEVTATLRRRFELSPLILPASNDEVRTELQARIRGLDLIPGVLRSPATSRRGERTSVPGSLRSAARTGRPRGTRGRRHGAHRTLEPAAIDMADAGRARDPRRRGQPPTSDRHQPVVRREGTEGPGRPGDGIARAPARELGVSPRPMRA